MRPGSQSGMTLVEVVVATVAFMTVLASILGALETGAQTVEVTTVPNDLDRKAQRVVRRMANELMLAGSGTLLPVPQPPLGSSSLSFQRTQGWSGGAMAWGPVTSIGVEDDPQDPPDGLDNDGDGVIDEMRLMWRRDVGGPAEISEVWVEDVRRWMSGETPNGQDDNGNGLVDEAGMSFALEDSVLVIRLCLERRGLDQRTVTRTVEHALRLRN